MPCRFEPTMGASSAMTATDVAPAVPHPTGPDRALEPGPPPRVVLDDRLVALVTGVLGVAAAFGIVAAAHADPVSIRGAALPIGAGFVAFAGLLGGLWRYWG